MNRLGRLVSITVRAFTYFSSITHPKEKDGRVVCSGGLRHTQYIDTSVRDPSIKETYSSHRQYRFRQRPPP